MLCLHSFPFLGWFLCDECVLVLFVFCACRYGIPFGNLTEMLSDFLAHQ